MLKFKSRKGTAATLLTLGLVLIGSLVTIGISFLTTHNKIASNPRAGGGGCQVIGPGQSCCFTKDDGKEKLTYGSYDGMCNTQTNLDCSAHGVVSSYDADGPAYPCVGDTPVEGTGCGGPTSCGPGGVGPGGGTGSTGTTGPGGVECTDSNCSTWGNEPHEISYYDRSTFYDGLGCNSKKGIGDVNAAKKKCAEWGGQYCSEDPTNCNLLDPSYDDRDLWVKPDASLTDYYYLNSGCPGTGYLANDQTLINECTKKQGGGGGAGGAAGTGVDIVDMNNVTFLDCFPEGKSNVKSVAEQKCGTCSGIRSQCALTFVNPMYNVYCCASQK